MIGGGRGGEAALVAGLRPLPRDEAASGAASEAGREAGGGVGGGASPDVVLVCWGSFLAQSNGSHRRVASLLDFLCRRFERVAVYGYREHPAEPWTEAETRLFAERYPGVALVLDRETRALRAAKKLKEALVALLPAAAAPRILGAGLPGQAPRHARLMREGDPVWVVNYVDGLARLNGVRPARTVVETHDAKFAKRAKMTGRPVLSPDGLLRLRGEMASLAAPAAVVAITRAEATLFRALLDGGRVLCVPIYEEAAAPAGGAGLPSPFEHDLLFAASENPLNEQGFLRFAEASADWLGRWRVALCGRICERPAIRAHAARHPNVALLGFVDDLPALHTRAKACLSPTDGTGLKIKLVEALGHGKPVFASQHSMDGLMPGFERCVFPLDRAAFERVLGDPAALAAASEAAARYFAAFAGEGDRAALSDLLASLAAGRAARVSA